MVIGGRGGRRGVYFWDGGRGCFGDREEVGVRVMHVWGVGKDEIFFFREWFIC